MELDTKEYLSIGPFAKIGGLTIKALRHYDQIELLAPAHDDASGYRYYTLAQARTAEAIRKLRALEVPLDEIRTMLECSPAEVRERLGVHRARLQRRRLDGAAQERRCRLRRRRSGKTRERSRRGGSWPSSDGSSTGRNHSCWTQAKSTFSGRSRFATRGRYGSSPFTTVPPRTQSGR